MLLDCITLYNFRQYYKKQTIEFSKSTKRNVTVIHGENGSGKTALLNAFLWCLYGDLNLPNPEQIINEYAISSANVGETVEAYVKLEFNNNSLQYTLIRKISAEKINENDVHYHEPEIKLFFRTVEGQSEEVNNPNQEINGILPKDLRSYFFFDGERIDNLSKESGSDDIRNAIKTIMGLEILERSIEHTDAARKRFRNELKKYGDPETQKIIEEIEKLEAEEKEFEEKMKIFEDNGRAIEKEIKLVDERLTQIEEAKQLQHERERKLSELKTAENELKEQIKILNSTMSKLGHLAFTSELLNGTKNILNEVYNSEKIVGITESFINKLIKNKKCICGSPIEEGSEHLDHIIALKSKIDVDEVDHAVDQFKQEITRVDERRRVLFRDLRAIKKREIELRTEIRRLEEEIDEISTKLSEHDSEEIGNLENKRNNLVKEKSDLDKKIGALEEKILQVQERIRIKKQEQEKHKKIEAQSKLAEKRMKVCEDIILSMKKILKIREKNVKKQLQERISKVYDQFLRKNYRIEVSDGYELNVINDNGNYVAMSQGERQITSLSFIGAIVDIARETYNRENKNVFMDGGIYPIVMDSPFGALDSDHRERVSRGITKLADQVIVIVSTSQWKGEVEKEMKEFIGKEYNLNYNDPRYNKNEPYEYTEVIEVN